MDIVIRKAKEEDFPVILSLIRELADYEKSLEGVTNSVDLMKEERDYFNCYVAVTGGDEIIGMAIYFFAYYTWVGKSLYLEDIYVKQTYRRNKVGSKLLSKVFEIARKENCKRVRWQVLGWNEDAIAMYRKVGAEISSEWLNCNFDYKGILNFE